MLHQNLTEVKYVKYVAKYNATVCSIMQQGGQTVATFNRTDAKSQTL